MGVPKYRSLIALSLLPLLGGAAEPGFEGRHASPPPPAPGAWTAPGQFADSAAVHRSARNAQARFERIRVQYAPWSTWPSGGPCDETVGRFCLRFPPVPRGGWSDDPTWLPPPEAAEVIVAREELLMELARVAREQPGNHWVKGQRVRYLGEAGRWEEALEVARACRVPRAGWCSGLEGLALHHLGRIGEAEAAFRRALDELPPPERERWLDLGWVVDRDAWGDLRRAEGAEKSALTDRIWGFSDPLFLLDGNAFRTLHLSRRVEAEMQAEARNPHGLSWGRDMEEMLIRYGPEVAYERVRDRSIVPGPVPVVGRYDPFSRGLVPSARGLRDPATAPAEAFTTTERRVRSRHAPPAAPTIHALAPQVARFRRGEGILVVAAWELRHPVPTGPDSADVRPPAEVLESGAFLLPVEDPRRDALRRGNGRVWDDGRGGGIRGVATVEGKPEGQLLSLEVLDRTGHRAWRHREGLTMDPRHRDVVAISDLLLLEADGRASVSSGSTAPESSPETLEETLPRALPGVAVAAGPVEVAWEVYGLPSEVDRLRFRVTVEPEGRGLLRRAGEALRFLSPPAPVEIRWEEGRPPPPSGPAGEVPVFRRVQLDLSGVEPGSYRLTLSLALPGRTETVSSRLLEVAEGEMER